MGRPKNIKTREDRVKEGVSLLKQLREGGVRDISPGFLELKERIGDWVAGEGSWEGVIDFKEYRRVAEVSLPKYDNRAADINFRLS